MKRKNYGSTLIAALRSIEDKMEQTENQLNYATDELLIDSLIFEMEALNKRYAYYLRLCRELNVRLGEDYAV